ncbi:MAG: response regulator [Planctomycetota bacterium]
MNDAGNPLILLVEDNSDEVELTRASFARTDRSVEVHRVANGKECMAFLQKQGPYSQAPTPDVVLLDLNMPVMDGRAVLKKVSQDPDLRSVPIVVLSTSKATTDIELSYQLGCRSYLVKPIDFNEFQELVTTFCEYWFRVVALP